MAYEAIGKTYECHEHEWFFYSTDLFNRGGNRKIHTTISTSPVRYNRLCVSEIKYKTDFKKKKGIFFNNPKRHIQF